MIKKYSNKSLYIAFASILSLLAIKLFAHAIVTGKNDMESFQIIRGMQISLMFLATSLICGICYLLFGRRKIAILGGMFIMLFTIPLYGLVQNTLGVWLYLSIFVSVLLVYIFTRWVLSTLLASKTKRDLRKKLTHVGLLTIILHILLTLFNVYLYRFVSIAHYT